MIVTYIVEHAKVDVRRLVESQFMGKIAYNTECKKCRTKSVKESEFFELELNVKVVAPPPNTNHYDSPCARGSKQLRIH